MADNVNIEAKLCSYVEGDLDPAGRAEIERYLVANPQYRPILEELVRTRGELRALPRVKAPLDLQENLSGQLERSALLGDEKLLRDVGRRNFPHVRAWAAVLLLTAALAAIVYSVLPAKKAQMTELANLTTTPVDVFAATAPTSNLADAAVNQTVAAMSAPMPTTAPATQLASAEQMASTEMPTATEPAPKLDSAVAQSVIVPAANLPAAEAQVYSYLSSQNYSFGSTSAKDAAPQSATVGDAFDKTLRAKPLGGPEVRMIVVRQLTDNQLRQTRSQMESIGAPATFAPPAFAVVSENQNLKQAIPGALANASHTAGAKLFDKSPVYKPLATSMPAGGEVDLTPGETVHVTAEDTGLGGVTAMDDNLTIDADGNLTLPLVGKVRAAGMPPAALSRSIALAYEIAKSPTKANWTIRPVPTTNLALTTTRPMMDAAESFRLSPATAAMPVTRPSTSVSIDQAGQGGASLMSPERVAPLAATSVPSTMTSAIATTLPDETRSDLTIVLISTSTPSPTTLPTTSPTSNQSPPTTAPLAK